MSVLFFLLSSKKTPWFSCDKAHYNSTEKGAEAGEKTCLQVAHRLRLTVSLYNKSKTASKRTQMWDSFVFFFFFFFSYSRQKHNCTREERGTCPFTNTTPGLTMGDRLPLPALAGTLLLVVLGLLTLLPHSILGKPAEEEEEAANAGSSALLQRVKRGWVWNQFFVLEEYTGLEPLYIGKVSDVLYEHTHTHTHTREVMTWRNVTRAGLQAWSGSSSSDWPFSPVFGVFTSCTQGKV